MGIARDRGRAAERLAAAYLELAGLEVLERNQRVGGVEVDLLARDGRIAVLVEVKYRNRADYGGAALALGWSQRERLARAAAMLAAHQDRVRVDVVAIELGGDGASVRHYRNVLADP